MHSADALQMLELRTWHITNGCGELIFAFDRDIQEVLNCWVQAWFLVA